MVTLSKQQEAILRGLVESGHFETLEEALDEILSPFEIDDEGEHLTPQQIRRLEESMAQADRGEGKHFRTAEESYAAMSELLNNS